MDKNTLTGLLLMGAVIIGFMWLNKPSDEEIARQRELQQKEAQAINNPSDVDLTVIDSIPFEEKQRIIHAVEKYGVRDTLGNYNLIVNDIDLTVAEDRLLTGIVTTPDSAIEISTLLTSDIHGLDSNVARKALNNLETSISTIEKYQSFAKYLKGKEEIVALGNEKLKLELSTKGGVISKAILTGYKSFDGSDVALIDSKTDGYGFLLPTTGQRIDTKDFYFTATKESETSVLMSLELGDGAMWGIRYILLPDSYTVGMEIVQQGMLAVMPSNIASIDFNWTQKMARNESGRMFEERNSAIYYMFGNGDVENLDENKDDNEDVNDKLKWIAFKNQFFSSVLIAKNNFTSAKMESKVLENDENYLKTMSAKTTLEYSPTAEKPVTFTFFLGPNSYPLLSDLQKEIEPGTNLHLTNLIPLGWSLFRWINTLIIIPVFTFLGSFIGNYGIIILLLTIFIKIILFPFTYKSYMSQAKTRVLQPEVKEINEKYPGKENALKRQQEMMALYRRAGANPMSGCLPMLLQFPILIAMYNFFPSAIELRGEPFLWAKDLSAPDAIISWDFNIPIISSTFGNHISLFCLLMTVVNIIYTRVTMQNQAGGASMPGMKWMMYLMPVLFLVFFNNYASGLSYYYFLSLLITIIQTYVFRRVVSEEKVRAVMRENAKKPKKKSGFMARLEEAQRRQQAMLREQEKRKKGNNRR